MFAIGFGSILIYIIVLAVTLFVIYWAFENYNFIGGYIVCYVANLLSSILQGSFSAMQLLTGLLSALISAAIYWLFYRKSESFGDFAKKYVIFCIAIVVIIILFAVIMSATVANSILS